MMSRQMLFTEKIKELRIQNQMPQRQVVAIDLDTATPCKIEKGERGDKVTDTVSNEHIVESEALSMTTENLRRRG